MLSGAVVALAIAAPAANAKTVQGTVVHGNHRSHSFVVADQRGKLSAVHATRSPRIGSRVSLSAVSLANGTYKAGAIKVRGHAHRARVRGVVTYVDRAHGAYVLSAHGVSMLVRGSRSSAHRARAASDSLPAIGQDVSVVASLDDSSDQELVADPSTMTTSAATGPVKLEGIVQSVDPATRTLTISADDDDALGQSIKVSLPASFDLTRFAVGDEVELAATPNSDGSYTALASSGDDNEQDAADTGDDQGDSGQLGDNGDNGRGSHGDGSHGDGSHGDGGND
jgi:hypothetical protein